MSNRLTTVTVLCLALFGVCFFINEYLGAPDLFEDPDKPRELLRLFSYLAVVDVLLEIIPNVIRKMRGGRLKEILPPLCFLIGVYVIIFCMNPEAIENPSLKYWLITALIVFMIGWRLIKRYLVKRWGQPVKDNDKNV